jgi:DMSO/TMAO reductase YedYZ heme-binding membrane subunit
MTQFMWFLTRSSGVVALALIIAALADGLVFSGRNAGKRRLRPAWWLDLHRGLGGYALAFTGLHLLTSFLASDLGVGLAQIFVPGTASYATTAFTLGVLSFYGLLAVVLTSWPKKRLRHRAWHAVHLLSIPAAVLAVLHAYQLGSDAQSPRYQSVFVVLIGLAMYPAGLRITGIARRRRARRERSTVRVAAPPASMPALEAAALERELVGAGR